MDGSDDQSVLSSAHSRHSGCTVFTMLPLSSFSMPVLATRIFFIRIVLVVLKGNLAGSRRSHLLRFFLACSKPTCLALEQGFSSWFSFYMKKISKLIVLDQIMFFFVGF